MFFPNVYSRSVLGSRIQRLTIPACGKCNNSWADDEAHFRNVLVMAGEVPNPPRQELYEDKVLRSFDEVDGSRRIRDLIPLMKPVEIKGKQRLKIYPAEDKRVLRVVRKIVRGLNHYHRLSTAIPDDRVWVDVLRYEIPEESVATMDIHHRDPEIVEYRYKCLDEPEVDIKSALGHKILQYSRVYWLSHEAR